MTDAAINSSDFELMMTDFDWLKKEGEITFNQGGAYFVPNNFSNLPNYDVAF